MSSVINVAQYILIKQPKITTMKLQKLCFYSQALSLARYGEPIFPEEFQAWENGPVSTELWNLHKGYFFAPQNKIGEYGSSLTRRQENLVDEIIGKLGGLSGKELSQKSHNEEPWKELRKGLEPDARSHGIISKESIKRFFSAEKVFAH